MPNLDEIHSVLIIRGEALMNCVMRLCKSRQFVALALCLMLTCVRPAMCHALSIDCMTSCTFAINGNQSEEAACSQFTKARAAAEAIHRVVNQYWQAVSEATTGATGDDHFVGIALANDPTAPWNGPWPVVVFETGYNTRANQRAVLNTVVDGRTFQQAVAAVGQMIQFEEDED